MMFKQMLISLPGRLPLSLIAVSNSSQCQNGPKPAISRTRAPVSLVVRSAWERVSQCMEQLYQACGQLYQKVLDLPSTLHTGR